MKEYKFVVHKAKEFLFDYFIYAKNLRDARRRMGEALVLYGYQGLRYRAVKSWSKVAHAV